MPTPIVAAAAEGVFARARRLERRSRASRSRRGRGVRRPRRRRCRVRARRNARSPARVTGRSASGRRARSRRVIVKALVPSPRSRRRAAASSREPCDGSVRVYALDGDLAAHTARPSRERRLSRRTATSSRRLTAREADLWDASTGKLLHSAHRTPLARHGRRVLPRQQHARHRERRPRLPHLGRRERASPARAARALLPRADGVVQPDRPLDRHVEPVHRRPLGRRHRPARPLSPGTHAPAHRCDVQPGRQLDPHRQRRRHGPDRPLRHLPQPPGLEQVARERLRNIG